MSNPDVVVVTVSNNPHIVKVISGRQGPAGPDPWLEPVQSITSTLPTLEIDYSLGKHVRLTLESSPILTVINWPAQNRIARLTLEIHNTGSFAITWPTEVLWPASVVPELSPSGKDVILLTTTSNGQEIFGFPAGLDFA